MFLSVIPALLNEPNVDDPHNNDAAAKFKDSRTEFKKIAREKCQNKGIKLDYLL